MEALIIAVAGLLTSVVMQGLKTVVTAIGEAPDGVKTAITAVVAQGSAALAHVSGVSLGGDPAQWSATAVQGVLVWLLSMGWHAGGKALRKGRT